MDENYMRKKKKDIYIKIVELMYSRYRKFINLYNLEKMLNFSYKIYDIILFLWI